MKHEPGMSFHDAHAQCSLLGVDISEDSFLRITKFMNLLEQSTKKVNLVGPAEIQRLWTRHVLESIAFIPFLHENTVIDVGTGAGFPGMILSLCGYDVTMIESRRKRCAFLETVARSCETSCRIWNCRVEDAGPFPEGSVFTSRAVKTPPEMVKLILPSSPEGFSLVTRISTREETCSNTIISEELPIPPLDRKGFIMQYRHPGIKNKRER